MKIIRHTISIILCFCLVTIMAATTYAKPKDSQHGPGEPILNGAEIMILGSQSDSQMMSYVITTKSGHIIVVDGGLDLDAEHLKSVLKEKGGVVKAWFITHPHSDHVGALSKLLEDDADITIEGLYYKFFDMNWYVRNEAYRADAVERAVNAFAKLDPQALHGDINAGDIIQVDDVSIKVLNNPYDYNFNSINNSSVAYRMEISGQRVLFLGDMGPEAGNSLMAEVGTEELKADIVQMAHHGQYGVSKEVYEAISPSVCMWNSPRWLYNNDNGGGKGSGPYLTLEVRAWMSELHVKKHYAVYDGDKIIK